MLGIPKLFTLFSGGKTRQKIAKQLEGNKGKVSNFTKYEYLIPPKPSGQLPIITSDQIDKLEEFVWFCRERGQMKYSEFIDGPFEEWRMGEHVLRSELQKLGYFQM